MSRDSWCRTKQRVTELYCHQTEFLRFASGRLISITCHLIGVKTSVNDDDDGDDDDDYELYSCLAYGWRAGNLNWPIRTQQAGKHLLSSRQCKLTGKALKSDNFAHWRWHELFPKGIYNSQNHITLQKRKKM